MLALRPPRRALHGHGTRHTAHGLASAATAQPGLLLPSGRSPALPSPRLPTALLSTLLSDYARPRARGASATSMISRHRCRCDPHSCSMQHVARSQLPRSCVASGEYHSLTRRVSPRTNQRNARAPAAPVQLPAALQHVGCHPPWTLAHISHKTAFPWAHCRHSLLLAHPPTDPDVAFGDARAAHAGRRRLWDGPRGAVRQLRVRRTRYARIRARHHGYGCPCPDRCPDCSDFGLL